MTVRNFVEGWQEEKTVMAGDTRLETLALLVFWNQKLEHHEDFEQSLVTNWL